jgi:hypothetical protein
VTTDTRATCVYYRAVLRDSWSVTRTAEMKTCCAGSGSNPGLGLGPEWMFANVWRRLLIRMFGSSQIVLSITGYMSKMG